MSRGLSFLARAAAALACVLPAIGQPANFSIAYADPNTGNVLPLSNNATLTFPNALVGSNSIINLRITNGGAGLGIVNSITLGGDAAFQLINLPAVPVSLPSQQQTNFSVRFAPQQQKAFTDTLTITINGQPVAINLAGQGIQPQYSYSLFDGTNTVAISPANPVSIPDTAVGQTSTVVISVTNTGTADGQISGVSVTGQGLSLTALPAFPLTVRVGASQRFTLTFAPTQPGTVNGQLTIGSDTFAIKANALGSRLVYTYTSSSSTVSVNEAGTVVFVPVAVGNTEALTFSIQNTGTTPVSILSISLPAATTVFSLSDLPALPLNLAPGATTKFTINFTPINTGTVTAALLINSSSFTLSGNGTAPPSLPAYQFQGATSGTQQPAQQASVGLTLASPYPSPLQGTLTLKFISMEFADDSSIQFASGGRTVSFTIPANTTKAVFGVNATSIPLQTGTTAGQIVITPSFAMQNGFNVTPASPDVLTLSIQPSAPQLVNAAITAETTSGFTLTVSGYTTSRVIRQLDIQFTGNDGQTFSPNHVTIDVSSTSATWFQNTASQAYGGSFLMAIPFVLSNGNSGQDLVHRVKSLSITATNDVGASPALSVAIP